MAKKKTKKKTARKKTQAKKKAARKKTQAKKKTAKTKTKKKAAKKKTAKTKAKKKTAKKTTARTSTAAKKKTAKKKTNRRKRKGGAVPWSERFKDRPGPWTCPKCGPLPSRLHPLYGEDEKHHCPMLNCDSVVALPKEEIEESQRRTGSWPPQRNKGKKVAIKNKK